MNEEMIKHQMQPCPFSCVSTCLAMLSGRPASEVVALLHEGYRANVITLREMLNGLKIKFSSFDSVDGGELVNEGAYLCTVPSLNIQGGNHQIIIVVTDCDYIVHDPVKGREGRLYYVKRGDANEALQVELGGFIIDAFISAEWMRTR